MAAKASQRKQEYVFCDDASSPSVLHIDVNQGSKQDFFSSVYASSKRASQEWPHFNEHLILSASGSL